MAATQMNLTAAKALIQKYNKEGLTNVEIAQRLRTAGYVSERTKKPINAFGVGYHVRDLKAPKVRLELAPAPGKQAGPTHPPTVVGNTDPRIRLALDILTSTLDPALAKEVAAKILNG